MYSLLKSFTLSAKGSLIGLSTGILLALVIPGKAIAQIVPADMLDYASSPILTVQSATPQVMLTMSRDHQYFFKAYNDYTDLDGDGLIKDEETTYNHDNFYYGYFDSYKCYDYESNRFRPKALTTDKYCDSVAGAWSGNFLNWAAMTRMDIVRKILYGGKRSTDSDSLTVLERAYLPHDAHSFAKFYNEADLNKLTPFNEATGITMCNTTAGNSDSSNVNSKSQTNTNPPLLRVVRGNFSLWAANERWQCTWAGESNTGTARNDNVVAQSGINADDRDPNQGSDGLTAQSGPNYRVRVEVCSTASFIDNDTVTPANRENCRAYPDGNYKPTGLLQRYGEDDLIEFGLMTGSFKKNISGGVLRKNTRSFRDEVNETDDGTFTSVDGIRSTLDTLRLYGYKYHGGNEGTYLNNSGDNCGFQLASITEGNCTSWGNPLSEIYLESLRYFAGLDATPAFQYSGSDRLGLEDEDWEDPVDSNNACAAISSVVFNASVSSYDHDQTGGISDLPGDPDVVAITDIVAAGEGILGNDWFVGRVPGETDEFCTQKTIDSLGAARGLCPEAPTVDGTYHVAGMAHHAKTNDIREDLDGTQTVTTYAVQLATTTPAIDVPLDIDDPTAGSATIIPAYRLLFNDGGGALVDFKVISPHTEVDDGTGDILNGVVGTPQDSTGVFDAKFYINWEDSEQGGDYDQDAWGILTYRLDTNPDTATLRIATHAIAQAGANGQLFGFVTSGTTQDGFHAYSGVYGGDFTSPYDGVGGVPGCTNCNALGEGGQDGPKAHTFTLTGTAAGQLENPLFYAAKWGGFEDINDNDIPDLDEEWDTRDADGNVGTDGQPDNYFFVTNPAELENSLRRVFDEILERVSSGTAAAVVANEQAGVGAVFQALYDPIRTDGDGNEVKWFGSLQALFLDGAGFLREDSNGNSQLDDYTVDRVIEVFFDDNEQRTRLRRFTSSTTDEFTNAGSTTAPLEDIKPVWNARDELSEVADVTTQRAYTASADTGRHIITWLDGGDLNNVVEDGEVVSFTTASFTNSNYGWLNMDDIDDAHDLVNYIRGEETAGLRNRTLDYNGDGSLQTMRLGDIVNSTPVPVAAPSEAFDLLAGDASYSTFRNQYQNRRQMIYVGANDGMLHAFNGGFFNPENATFETTPADGTLVTGHPLGSELWGYVPKNLLPHLQWLQRNDYEHVYYVDGQPRVFDARIFTPSATHPGGWGTVLVAGFRLGGGSDATGIDVIPDPGTPADTAQTKSAYVVMDITDPEQPPEVLAEITPPNLQYTTSLPAPVLLGSPTGTPNGWYLVFGSGPTNLGGVASGQNARLYAYDLNQMAQTPLATDNGVITTGGFTANGLDLGADAAGQFVGDPTVADFDLNMKAEALYFGTVGNADGDEGKLWRLAFGEDESPSEWGTPHVLLDADQPFVAQPSLTTDEFGRPWVIAGTGRFYANADKSSISEQSLYGFIDPNGIEGDTDSSIEKTIGDLIDVTDAVVAEGGQVDVEGDGTFETSIQNLQIEIASADADADGNVDHGGWVRNYESDASDPSQRSVNRSAVIGGIIFNTAFTPSLDLCGAEGRSVLLGLNFSTGTASGTPVFGTTACPSCPDGLQESVAEVDLGFGLASAPSINIGKPGQDDIPGKVTVVIQKSTGAIDTLEGQTGGGINSGEISWREFID